MKTADWMDLVGQRFALCVVPVSQPLSGTVQDSSGAVVAGAAPTLKNDSNGLHATTRSDAKGQYEFVQIEPSTCEITAKPVPAYH